MSHSLSDITYYEKIIKNGINEIEKSERIGPRIIVPLLAHYIYKFTGDIKSWNKVFFSLLIINSFFISIIAIYQIKFTKLLNLRLTFYPQFLLLSSFTVTSIYLAGLIDSSICCFIFIYIYYILKKNFFKSSFVILLLAFSKETALIHLILINISLLLNELYINNKISLSSLARSIFDIFLLALITNFLTYFFLDMSLFSYFIKFMYSSGMTRFNPQILDIIRFSFFIFVIPFLYFLHEIQKKTFIEPLCNFSIYRFNFFFYSNEIFWTRNREILVQFSWPIFLSICRQWITKFY